jgi:hypothetical protein
MDNNSIAVVNFLNETALRRDVRGFLEQYRQEVRIPEPKYACIGF